MNWMMMRRLGEFSSTHYRKVAHFALRAGVVAALAACGPTNPPGGAGGTGGAGGGGNFSGCKVGNYTGTFQGDITVLGTPATISGTVFLQLTENGTATGGVDGVDANNNPIVATFNGTADCSGTKQITGTITGTYTWTGLAFDVHGPLTGTYSPTGTSSGNYGPVTDATGVLGQSSGTWSVTYSTSQ